MEIIATDGAVSYDPPGPHFSWSHDFVYDSVERNVPEDVRASIQSLIRGRRTPRAVNRLKKIRDDQLKKIRESSGSAERILLLNGLLYLEEAFINLDDQQSALELGSIVSELTDQFVYHLGEGLNYLLVSSASLRNSAYEDMREAAKSLRALSREVEHRRGQLNTKLLLQIFVLLLENRLLKLESKYSRALAKLRRAERLYTKLQERFDLDIPSLLNHIMCMQALDYYYLHEFHDARVIFETLRRLGHNRLGVESYIARINFYHAEYLSSLMMFQNLLARTAEPRRQAGLLQDIGRTSMEMGRSKTAMKNIEESILLARRVSARFEEARALFYKASIESHRKQYKKALRTLSIAQQLFCGTDPHAKIKNTRYLFRSFLLESGIKLRQGELQQSAAALAEAKEYLPERPAKGLAGFPMEEALLLRQEAFIFALRGDISRSRASMSQALAYLDSIKRKCAGLYLARCCSEAAFLELHWNPHSPYISELLEEAKWIAKAADHKREVVRSLVTEILHWCAIHPLDEFELDLGQSELFSEQTRSTLLRSLEVSYARRPSQLVVGFLSGFIELSPRTLYTEKLIRVLTDSLDRTVKDDRNTVDLKRFAADIKGLIDKKILSPGVADTPELQLATGLLERVERHDGTEGSIMEYVRRLDFSYLQRELSPLRDDFEKYATYFKERLHKYA